MTTFRTDMPAQIRAILDAVEAPGAVKRTWICASCGKEAQPGYSSCQTCERMAVGARRRSLCDAARSTVPVSHLDCTFGSRNIRERVGAGSDADYRRAVTVAYQWAKRPEGALVLLGPAGAGKSSLMAAVLLQIIEAGSTWSSTTAEVQAARGAMWTSAFDLAKARRTSSLGQEAAGVQAAMRASVLAVDELGAERDSLGSEAVYEVLYERHASQRPTIYTSPLDREALAAKYGGGGERRLFERATVIRL